MGNRSVLISENTLFTIPFQLIELFFFPSDCYNCPPRLSFLHLMQLFHVYQLLYNVCVLCGVRRQFLSFLSVLLKSNDAKRGVIRSRKGKGKRRTDNWFCE